MNDSGYDVTSKILPNRASGYQPAGPNNFVNADYLDMSLPHAAGSLYSTARDLYRWDRALYTDKVLSKDSREKMFTVVSRNYAYGWTVAPLFNHKQIGHGGGINGFSTQISRFPDDDAVVIVLSNNQAGNPGALARDLAATLFGEKVTLPGEEKIVSVDSKVLDRHVGTYDVGPLKVTVTNETGHLMIQPTNQPKFEALPLSETQFTVRQVGATLNFVVGPDGRATELKLTQGGQTMSGKRIN
jgi:D-alanyl-D-alanine carboxypeptidase